MNNPSTWPPVYDFDSLATQINTLVLSHGIFDSFFQGDREVAMGVHLCQGDVISLSSPFPMIDAEGDISTFEDNFNTWMIIGNTCDLTREIIDSEYSHISPLYELRSDEPEPIMNGLRAYSSYKKFYIPSWRNRHHPGYYIDFSHMCSVHKSYLLNAEYVTMVARMNRISWLLFHSCIVRYLARDDGRQS